MLHFIFTLTIHNSIEIFDLPDFQLSLASFTILGNVIPLLNQECIEFVSKN